MNLWIMNIGFSNNSDAFNLNQSIHWQFGYFYTGPGWEITGERWIYEQKFASLFTNFKIKFDPFLPSLYASFTDAKSP